MHLPWFKFYGTEYLSDPKILGLTACERSCWVTILCLASSDMGVIKFLPESRLMALAGIDPLSPEWEATLGIYQKLEKLGMITACNDIVTLCNWEKRQLSDSYLRVKRYREKQKGSSNVTDREEKSREDKIRKDIYINNLNNINNKKKELIRKKSI